MIKFKLSCLKVTYSTGDFYFQRNWVLILLLVSIFILVGCSPITRQTSQSVQNFVPLNQDESLGQSFVSEFDGLRGIEIILDKQGELDGEILVTVETIPRSAESLVETVLPLNQISDSGFYTLNFEPIKRSNQMNYYIKFHMVGNESVKVGGSSPFSYLNGSMYINDRSVDQQIVFNLVYDPFWVMVGVIREIILWIVILLVGIFLFVLPGWGLLSSFWDGWNKRTFLEKILLSTGISLSIYPVLTLWLNLIGVQAGIWLAYVAPLVAIVIIAWRNRNMLKRGSIEIKLNNTIPSKSSISLLIFIILMIITTRFWVIRNIDVPLWGDSYHHTTISQLIVDNNGLFNSWDPYADLNSFTYHFGFHTLAANFHWVTGFTLPVSVLWVGQIMNILAVLALYPLVIKLGGNRWAGVIALLFSGMLISMPMFFVNWGRYTQLAGLVILPISMYFIWNSIERDGISWRSIGMPSILLAGLALTHYRVLFFGLGFMLIIFIYYLRQKILRESIIKALLIGAVSFILFLPWFLHVYGSTILEIFGEQITTSANAVAQSTVENNSIGNLNFYMPIWAWIMTGFALIVGIFKRPRSTLLIFLWSSLLLITANPHWIGLPGTGVLSNFAVFISVYIPASLLIGLVGGVFLEEILNRNVKRQWIYISGLFVLFFVLSIWGLQMRISDVDIDDFALATRPDARAMDWISANVSQDANFLVNSFLAYNGTLAVGSDGGLWLPLLAGRNTVLPPITYGFEQGTETNNLKTTNDLIETVVSSGPTDPGVIQMLYEQGVTHAYIGQRRGRVNYYGTDTLDPNMLSVDPHYQPIYHEDLVWIFQIIP